MRFLLSGRARWAALVAVVLGPVVVALVAAGPAAAKTLKVCPSGCPYTSIQAAIDAAKSGNTIAIAAGTYTGRLTIPGSLTSLTLTGAGAGQTTISPASSTDLGSVVTIASGVSVTTSAVTISGGNCTTDPNHLCLNDGGGINNAGALTLRTSTVSGNTAGNGGGIFNSGRVTLSGSTVSGNTAGGGGGGIVNAGTATLNGSTVSGNTAGNGGGINNVGTLTLNESTVSGNTATRGGGIYNSGTATLNESTVSDNTASLGGASIDNDNGTVTLNESTISPDCVGC